MSIRKILFVTLVKIDSLTESGLYQDLISKFVSEAYHVTIICPRERRYGSNSRIIYSDNVKIIQVKSLNIQKTNVFEKTISTFLIEFLYIMSFLKNCKKESYDIGVFTTPPIFLTNFIKFLSKKNVKVKYLLLKDIFPQNALDLNITTKYSPFYHYSRFIEKILYKKVDFIGCMSKANLNFILKHNSIDKKKLEINPNTIDVSKYPKKKNYNQSLKGINLIYGGNLGLPQNPILIAEFISQLELIDDVFFKIFGNGTGFIFLKNYIKKNKIRKTIIKSNLSKEMYFDELEKSDIGLIFLNENFTIPNFPSRILDYLYYDLAIISNTDNNTDVTDMILNNKIGKCFFGINETCKMIMEIKKIRDNDAYLKSLNSNIVLTRDFNVDISFKLIDNKIC